MAQEEVMQADLSNDPIQVAIADDTNNPDGYVKAGKMGSRKVR